MAEHFPGSGLRVSHVYGFLVVSRLVTLTVEYVTPSLLRSESRFPDSELMMGSFVPGLLVLA